MSDHHKGHHEDEDPSEDHTFMEFLFNPRNKTVLGRTAKSWFMLTVFYAFYYSAIAILTYFMLLTYKNNMIQDPKSANSKPKTQNRISTPGVATFPATEILVVDSNRMNIIEQIDQVNEHFLSFAKSETEKNKLMNLGDCSPICKDTDHECKNPPIKMSYNKGTPCVFYQINKVIDWYPYSYDSLNNEHVTPRVDKDTSLVGSVVEKFDPKKIYLYCYDLDNIKGYNNATDRISKISYFSSDDESSNEAKNYGTFNYNHWPVDMKSSNPFVAIKVEINPKYYGELVNVACQSYAANIALNEKINQGFAAMAITVESVGESSIARINAGFRGEEEVDGDIQEI